MKNPYVSFSYLATNPNFNKNVCARSEKSGKLIQNRSPIFRNPSHPIQSHRIVKIIMKYRNSYYNDSIRGHH